MMSMCDLRLSSYQDMQWSTASVYDDTASRAAVAGLSFAPRKTLPTLQDIDTLQVRGRDTLPSVYHLCNR